MGQALQRRIVHAHLRIDAIDLRQVRRTGDRDINHQILYEDRLATSRCPRDECMGRIARLVAEGLAKVQIEDLAVELSKSDQERQVDVVRPTVRNFVPDVPQGHNLTMLPLNRNHNLAGPGRHGDYVQRVSGEEPLAAVLNIFCLKPVSFRISGRGRRSG